jgi:hypothetical protein
VRETRAVVNLRQVVIFACRQEMARARAQDEDVFLAVERFREDIADVVEDAIYEARGWRAIDEQWQREAHERAVRLAAECRQVTRAS